MIFTDDEIVASYREAKNKKNQISILAELNDTSEDIIKTVLKSKGIDLRGGNCRPKKIAAQIEAADPVPGEAGYKKETVVAPPLGIAPREIAESAFNESRIHDIVRAMCRYFDADKTIPKEWREELKERL